MVVTANKTPLPVLSNPAEQEFNDFLDRANPPCDYEHQLMKEHSARVAAIFEGKITPPYELEIQPCSLCNLACDFCFGRFYERLPNLLNKEAFEKIAEDVQEFREGRFGIDTVKFCGTTGEPLVNPFTIGSIGLFKKAGKKVILFTNGLLLDKKIEERFYADYVLEADKLNISLDAGSEEVFNALKGRPGFERIVSSIKYLAEEKRKKEKSTNIVVSYVIGNSNLQDVVQATKRVKAVGADEIRFRVDFTDVQRLKHSADYINSFLDAAQLLEDENFKVVSAYSTDEIAKGDGVFTSSGRRCFNHHFWACIGPNAELYACGHRTYSGVKSFGNVLKHSIRDLWTDKQRLEDVANLPDKYCKVCSPSSLRRNDFMTFLANQPINQVAGWCVKRGYSL